MPRRDVRLSPDHAVFVNGVLIPVKLLANGVTILEELTTPDNRRVCFLQAPDGAHVELIEKT